MYLHAAPLLRGLCGTGWLYRLRSVKPMFRLAIHRNRIRSGAGRRGVAAVEAALILPVALMLMLGTWEVGRMVEVSQVLNNAAREGGATPRPGSTPTARSNRSL